MALILDAYKAVDLVVRKLAMLLAALVIIAWFDLSGPVAYILVLIGIFLDGYAIIGALREGKPLT